jgi:hypothetical protein
MSLANAARRAARWRQRNPGAKYGLRGNDFENMKQQQNGCCLICGRQPKRFCVDHDHVTGKIRGLLCFRCNTGLGAFADSIKGLLAAVAYLQQHGK